MLQLNYKKNGDMFSLDEFNALCYLLMQQDWVETQYLTLGENKGEFGVYTIKDNDNVLTELKEYFVINRVDKSFYIYIKQDAFTSKYSFVFDVYNSEISNYITEDGESVSESRSPIDFEDNFTDDEEIDLKLKTVTFNDFEVVDNTTFRVKVRPSSFGLKTGDYIKKECKIHVSYDDEINWEDGRAVEPEWIICETFEEMKNAINTTPSRGVTKLRLLGGDTYSFDGEIIIDNQKTIIIEGGNIYSDNRSILDAQSNSKHFSIKPDSHLEITNCKLINGDGTDVNITDDLDLAGGSIEMYGRYALEDDSYELHYATCKLMGCVFENCVAIRGGAIYNDCGQLTIKNTDFINCDAEIGGALHTNSVKFYHDRSNQVYVDESPITLGNGVSRITLNLNHQQNLQYIKDNNFDLSEHITGVYNKTGTKLFNCSLEKVNNYQYDVTISGNLTAGTFYLAGNSWICTRTLKRYTKNGNSYVGVETDDIDDIQSH